MKNNFSISILVFFLMICNSTYQAQNISNEKPKRTYTQKANNTNVVSTGATKPTRTYTTKDNTTSTTPAATKPTRTYTTNPNKEVKAPQKTIPANNTSATTNNAPKKEISEESKPTKESFWTKWLGKKTNNTSVKTTELYKGHPVYIGPKGGKYYINKNGNKTYIK